jgi:drug/metabolite transporter (DMT)-like permease
MRLLDRPYLLLVLSSLFWAGNTIVGRAAVDLVPPATLTFVRWAIALVVLLPFVWSHLARDWPAIRRHLLLIFAFAITGSAGYNVIAYLALHYTQAINSLLLQSVTPLFVALWTFALFRERLTLMQAAGITTSLTGALIIVCRGDLGVLAHFAFNAGDIMILVGLVFYALYTALLRLRPRMHPLSFLTATVAASVVLMVPPVVYELATGHIAVIEPRTLAAFAYVGIFPSVVAYICLNRGIELIGANRAAPFIHLMPVFGSILAIIFLGEQLQPFHAIGYALVATGVALAARK